MNEAYSLNCLNDLDPALVEEAAAPRRRRPRVWKVAVIAACLCVAVVGTAFTSNLLAGNFRAVEIITKGVIVEPFTGVQILYNGFKFTGGAIEFIPLDEVPDVIVSMAEENGVNSVGESFKTIADAQEYYQFKLPENTVLEQYDERACTTILSSSAEGPTTLYFHQYFYNVGGVESLNLEVGITAYTELMYDPDRELWFQSGYPLEYSYSLDTYRLDNISAMIAHAQYTGFGTPDPHYGEECYSAHLIFNGMEYSLSARCDQDPSQALTLLQDVLRGFDITME